jgi:hypothetical protein
MIDHDRCLRELTGQRRDLRCVERDYMHLNRKTQILRLAKRGAYARVLQVPVTDRARGGRRSSFGAIDVDPERHNASGVAFHQRLHTGWRISRYRIEQARPLEESPPWLVGEAVFEVPVIVLVWLGMDDDDAVDACLGCKISVFRQRRCRRLINGACVIREPLRLEQMDVRVDQRSALRRAEASGCGCRDRGHEKVSPVLHHFHGFSS